MMTRSGSLTLAFVAAWLLACGTTATPTPSPQDGGQDSGGNDCVGAGGLCIPLTATSSCGAGYAADGTHSCGGAGASCCMPSKDGGADAATVTCAAAGGSCTGIGACGVGQGHMGDPKYTGCSGGSSVCCFTPWTSCGGAETFLCCSNTAQFRPVCSDGQLACGAGLTKCFQDGGTD